MIEIRKFVESMSEADRKEFVSLVLMAYIQDKLKVDDSVKRRFKIITGG